MSNACLLSKARLIMQRRAGGAALLIVPLALAAPGKANSVLFNVGDLSISSGITGGAFGNVNASTTAGGAAVQLGGDSKPPVMPVGFSSNPPYLPAGFAWENQGSIVYYWSGGFDAGTVTNADNLLVGYNLNFQGILSATTPPHTDIGPVSWALKAYVFSDPNGTPGTEMATYLDSGSGLGSYSNTNTASFGVPGAPAFWSVELDVQWDLPTTLEQQNIGVPPIQVAAFPEDRLVIDPSIQLSVVSFAGSTPAPLPPAIWIGGPMIAAIALLRPLKKLLQPLTLHPSSLGDETA